jgi:exosortase A-associated hydrolase 2
VSRPTLTGEFIAGPKGPIFVLLRKPSARIRGCVLVVPPFAEEMNKCRRMMSELAFGLAEQGIATLQPDLYGTGDSGGDFADGDWSVWRQDLAAAVGWAETRGCPVTGVLAIRLGAALAVAAQGNGAIPAASNAVLWQPVFDGGRFLTQFLRLRTAASLMDDRKETLAELRAKLQAGESLEVAGYALSGRLAEDLDRIAAPERLPATLGATAWLEVVRDADGQLPVPSQKLIEATRGAGASVGAVGLVSEPFWASTEIVVNQAFLSHTFSHFGGRGLG